MAFMKDQLNINVWSGEVPRYDSLGNPINPQQTAISPSVWPVVTCDMIEPGMRTNWTFEDAYNDVGAVKIQVYGTTKAQVQSAYDEIWELWADSSNWEDVALNPSGQAANPYYVIQMLQTGYWLGQEKDVRLYGSLLCFRGDLIYDPCQIHGAVTTR